MIACIVPSDVAGEMAWVAPVALGQELVGRLWVTAPPAVPAPVQRRVIERFALVVALELLKVRHLVGVESRLSGDLLADLLRPGGPVQPHAVGDRAAALGHDLARPHVVVVLVVAGPVQPGVRLLELVRSAAGPDGRPLVGLYEDQYVLLLPADPDPGEMIRQVYTQAEKAAGQGGVVTLVAGPTAGAVEDYAAAYRVARGAAELCRGTRPGGMHGRHPAARSVRPASGDGGPGGFAQVRADVAEPAGRARRPTRWRARPHSPRVAARELLHSGRRRRAVGSPNTVTYRLGRIEQLSGRSLRGVDTRLELQLALTVWDIAGSTPGASPGCG